MLWMCGNRAWPPLVRLASQNAVLPCNRVQAAKHAKLRELHEALRAWTKGPLPPAIHELTRAADSTRTVRACAVWCLQSCPLIRPRPLLALCTYPEGQSTHFCPLQLAREASGVQGHTLPVTPAPTLQLAGPCLLPLLPSQAHGYDVPSDDKHMGTVRAYGPTVLLIVELNRSMGADACALLGDRVFIDKLR